VAAGVLEDAPDVARLRLAHHLAQRPLHGPFVDHALSPRGLRARHEEVLRLEVGVPARHRDRSPHRILQLADVAGPAVLLERGEALVTEEVGAALGVHLDEVVRQKRDVIAALPQRRQVDGDHVDAVEEVLAEFAVLHRRGEIELGRHEHAHVEPDGLLPAEALERALLQDAQQLHLRLDRHVVDVVEEQDTPVGPFEPPLFQRARVRERALLVAEDLVLEQRLRKTGAAQHDERRGGAGRELVDQLRDQLLARAGLAGDQGVLVTRRDRADEVEDLPHRVALADDPRARAVRAHLVAQRDVLALETPELGQRRDPTQDVLVQEGLQHVVVGAVADRLDGALDGPVARDHDDLEAGVDRLGRLEQADPVHPRHADVGDQHIEPVGPELLVRRLAVRDDGDLVASLVEVVPERDGDAALVVGEQDVHRGGDLNRGRRAKQGPALLTP
jgi:hypothetical protein